MTKHRYAFRVAVLSAAVFAALVPLPRTFIERFYSTLLYPHVQHVLTRFSNLTSVSLFDVAVLAVVGAWLVALIADLRQKRWKAVLVRSIVWASVVYLYFVLVWGFNYRREKLASRLEFDAGAVSPEHALSLASQAVEGLNLTYAEAHAQPLESGAVEPALADGFVRAQRSLGIRDPAIPGRPKSTWLNPFFRLTGVSGMTDPVLETLIGDSLLPVERPFVIAHEWGHLAGFADESEASFLGWLTCIHGSAADQYSGWQFVYYEAMPVTRPGDRKRVVQRLEPGPLADLRAIDEREHEQISPRVSRIVSLIYDRYLKANHIQSGIANYDEAAGLLLGVRFAPDWTPRMIHH